MFRLMFLIGCLRECVGANRARSGAKIRDMMQTHGILILLGHLVSSVNSNRHAESAFVLQVQDHLEMSMIGLAETEKASNDVVLGLLEQHIIQPCCHRSWH
jgi:hypothetical protein